MKSFVAALLTAGGATDIAELRQVDLASRIAAKNSLLQQYRARLPGWKIWLLLTTEIRVLRSVTITPRYQRMAVRIRLR